ASVKPRCSCSRATTRSRKTPGFSTGTRTAAAQTVRSCESVKASISPWSWRYDGCQPLQRRLFASARLGRPADCTLGEGLISPKLEAICSLGESQRHGAFDLRAQRDAGRVLRPPRNGRQRRDAPLLDARDGRGGSDALRAPDLRADGGRLAPSGARPEGD